MTTATHTLLSTGRVGAILRAEDLGRARHFYSEILGLPVEDSARGGEFTVRVGDGGFSVYGRPGMAAPENTTLGFEVEDLEATLVELRSHGVVLEEYDIPEMGLVTHHGIAELDGSRVAWFKDSEGNILSVMEAPSVS